MPIIPTITLRTLYINFFHKTNIQCWCFYKTLLPKHIKIQIFTHQNHEAFKYRWNVFPMKHNTSFTLNIFIQIFESLKKSRTPYAKHSILLFSNVIDPPPSPLAKNLCKHGSSLPPPCIFNPTVYYILTPLGVWSLPLFLLAILSAKEIIQKEYLGTDLEYV